MTLNQTVKSLNDFATAHSQIGHFFFGETPNFDTSGTTNGVCMIVDTEPFPLSESTLTYVFKVYMGDLVHKDLSNRTEVLSDTLQILLDLVAWAQHPDREWVFERSTNIEEFNDSFDCELYGQWITIKLKTSAPFNRCAIPTN